MAGADEANPNESTPGIDGAVLRAAQRDLHGIGVRIFNAKAALTALRTGRGLRLSPQRRHSFEAQAVKLAATLREADHAARDFAGHLAALLEHAERAAKAAPLADISDDEFNNALAAIKRERLAIIYGKAGGQ